MGFVVQIYVKFVNFLYFKISAHMAQPQPIKMKHKNSIAELDYEFNGIKLPLLQMTDPYYPHSKLAKSVFAGYYILFFMYSMIFMITYPLLNFLEGRPLFQITVIKLVQTNIQWDFICACVFIFMALVLTQLSQALRGVFSKVLIIVTILTFITSSVFIVKTSKMYFTDRIFIIILGWALCMKTVSYIYDKKRQKEYNPITIKWTQLQKQKKMNRIQKRFLFLISPLPIYHIFVQQHNPKLPIHRKYVLTKFFVTFACVLVNNILIVKFIEPACKEDNLSFVALSFKLIPLTFYINMVLYYMVMDNVLAALSELSRISNRVLYLDWWNAQTINQFLQKWCLIINMTTIEFLPGLSQRGRNSLHVGLLQLLLLAIFGHSINLFVCIGFIGVLMIVYYIGDIRYIQNNMIVHVLCMSFTPIMIALEVKYNIFSKGILG